MRTFSLLGFGIATALVVSCGDATSAPLAPVIGGVDDTTWARLGQTCTEQATVVAGLKPMALVPATLFDNSAPQRARWDFAQIQDWYRYLNAYHTWPLASVTMSDINEKYNRLEYGIVADSARKTLEARFKPLGLPCFLVAILVVPPASF